MTTPKSAEESTMPEETNFKQSIFHEKARAVLSRIKQDGMLRQGDPVETLKMFIEDEYRAGRAAGLAEGKRKGGIDIMAKATSDYDGVTGEKSDKFVTLETLHNIIRSVCGEKA